MAPPRELDIVLLGATGYTGKLTAEYITTNLPTNLKWAIAGRSESKLNSLAAHLDTINPARTKPEVIAVNLTTAELNPLAKRTKVLLNTVGPYHLYSTPVVQACAENGTHYLDVTGETPWVYEIIAKFDRVAKKTGAIIIPEIGVESTPSDILAYTATRLIREVWDCGVSDMVASIHELKSSGVSGGTLATAIGILDHYSLRDIRKSLGNPFALSPVSTRDHRRGQNPIPETYSRTIFQKLTGVWEYPFLGTLTTSITTPNVAIVHRSSGINPNFYGYNFTYEEYMRCSSALTGYLIHFAITLSSVLLLVPPIRWFLKSIVTAPGLGPAIEAGKKDRFELRGVATAELVSPKPGRALSSFVYEGESLYVFTAVALAEGASVLLSRGAVDGLQKKYGGGILTPSCLGDKFVEGLEKGGVKISVQQIGDVGPK